MPKRIMLFLILYLCLVCSCDKKLSTTPPDPEPFSGEFSINSKPTNYQIYLDGKISGLTTPATFSHIEEKEYQITLKHNWYLDTTFSINVTGIDNNYFIKSEDNPDFSGKIICRSYPAGADIFLDDSLTTLKTHGILTKVYPGKHTVRYELLGYRAVSKEVTVCSNDSLVFTTPLVDTTIWLVYNTSNSQLPSNSLHCLARNPNLEDRIWIGTDDLGVVSLSFSHWKNFNTTNSPIPVNIINAISLGSLGKVVMATYEGVAIYFNDNWEIFNNSNSPLESNIINDVIWQREFGSYTTGIIIRPAKYYFATGAGIYTYSDQSLYPEEAINDLLPSSNTTCLGVIESYNQRILAVGTYNSGLMVVDEFTNSTNYYNIANSGFISDQVTAVYVTSGSRDIYAGVKISSGSGSAVGSLYYHPANGEWEEINLDLAVINSIKVGLSKTWVGTNNGLYVLENNTQVEEHYTKENSPLPSNNVYDIELESGGNVWLATGKGLVRFKTK